MGRIDGYPAIVDRPGLGAVTESARRRDVLRILERYIIEIIEKYNLCPWAYSARLNGAIGTDILWGTPTMDAWLECGAALLAKPGIQIAMVVVPELACSPSDLRLIRDQVSAQLSNVGVAQFHPDAPLDLATPSRLVPYLRRSPDPLLQLIPLQLLEAVRGRVVSTAERTAQAQMLRGIAPLPKPELTEHIAATNHARVLRDIDAIEAALADIRADRNRTYAQWEG